MPHTVVLSEPARPASPAEVRTLRVAVAGCGVVGGELLRQLREGSSSMEREHGLRVQVVRVLARDAARPRAVELPPGLLTTDLEEFLATDCDLVVEAIGGLQPAERIARHALSRRRGLVTANKALLAAHGGALAALAQARGAALGYEAAVAGGVPIVRVLRDSLPHAGVRAIRGILNGTTNYILTRMAAGVPFATALSEAQASGFAEADPTRDLDGQDAADKISILAWQAFGADPARLPVSRAGLLPDPDRLVGDAAALGGVARLVAECAWVTGGVSASVEPVIVSRDSDLARASAEENLVVVETATSGLIRLSGPGAGGGPTASALLSDLLRSIPALPHARAAEVAGVADPRPHRWAVSVQGAAQARSALLRAAERARVEVAAVEGGPGRDAVRAITAPLTRARADLLLRALQAASLRPLLIRYEAGA